MLEADLVDDLRLVVSPVLLGQGKRAFGEVGDKRKLQLSSSETTGDGISLLTYERVR